MRSPIVIRVLSALMAVAPLPAGAQEAPAWTPPALPQLYQGFSELQPPLEERIAEHHGIVGVVLLDSNTGEMLSIRGEEPFPSASNMTRENRDTSWTAANEAETLLADISRIVFDGLNP